MAIKTFKRYEIKYSVTQEQYKSICGELNKKMTLDKFCKDGNSYMIYNLYFDTEDDEVIINCLNKPYYKEKLRIRSYKMPTSGEDIVFVELKKKIGGIVAKRRADMTYCQAMDFVLNGKLPPQNNYQNVQVVSEIADFIKRHPLSPKVYISYERSAFFDSNNCEFRVSFDKNILTRRTAVNLTDDDYGTELLTDDSYLMEIKCTGQIPLWLCSILSELKLYKTKFSKYGTEYQQYLAQKTLFKTKPPSRYAGASVYDYTKLFNTALGDEQVC